MLLELCLIIGGVFFFKNRKRKREQAAAAGCYGTPYPPAHHDHGHHPHPHYGPIVSRPQRQMNYTEHEVPPPPYASLRPQSDALGYERQDYYGSSSNHETMPHQYGVVEPKKKGFFHQHR